MVVVWHEGMSENITSYSPLVRDWTEDPHSIKDSKGRELMFMAARPQDLTHNPECGYLMCEGLVMLDHNNRPIKAYPGAPRTLAADTIEPQAFLLEGLRRVLGMTHWDLRARMPEEYDTKLGTRLLQGPSVFSNRVIFWRKFHNLDSTENHVGVWHKRRTPKASGTKGIDPSTVSNEGKSTRENVADGMDNPDFAPNFPPQYPYPPPNTDESGSNHQPFGLSLRHIPMQTTHHLGSDSVEWDDFPDLENPNVAK